MTRNVLFSFVGETPQVVTETLYFLLKKWDIIDGVVHLLTTSEDEKEKKIKTNSLDLVKENGWIARFNDAYKTSWKPCDDSVFVWEQEGVQILPFDDIYSGSENNKAIDAITRIIYYWTVIQKDVKLFVSLAGGRKQLGSYMYQALSWFGSPSMKLCHVIPSKNFEKIAKNKSWGKIQWVDGYFPEPGAGSSRKERAEKAFGRKEINFVEQPVIYLKRLLPNFFGINKIIDFTQPYLDEEKKSATFPFAEKVELGNYLTFDSMLHRYEFMQGLFKDSPKSVQVYLDMGSNNLILISNELKKSLPAEDMTLFLFYFLYKINKMDFKVFKKENLNKFFQEKENIRKVLEEKFKGKSGKQSLKKLGKEDVKELGKEDVKELIEELIEEAAEELGKKCCYNPYFFINQPFDFMNDENLVNIFDESLSQILGNKRILTYRKKGDVIENYYSNDCVNYYKCYSMLDVKLDEYTGYNINIDANIDNYNYKTLTLLLGGDVYNKYIRRIDKSIEFLDFLESEPAKEIITTIREIIRDSNGNEVNIVVTSGQLELIKHELSKGRCKIEAKVKEYENKEKRQQLLNAIATNINSAFSNLIKLQDEFSPSGLKISIVAAPQRSRSGNPILRSSSRYLEIENIESLDVKIGKG